MVCIYAYMHMLEYEVEMAKRWAEEIGPRERGGGLAANHFVIIVNTIRHLGQRGLVLCTYCILSKERATDLGLHVA